MPASFVSGEHRLQQALSTAERELVRWGRSAVLSRRGCVCQRRLGFAAAPKKMPSREPWFKRRLTWFVCFFFAAGDYEGIVSES